MSCKFKVGDKVRVVANRTEHNQTNGYEFEVLQAMPTGDLNGPYYHGRGKNGGTLSFYETDLEAVKCGRERLADQLKRDDEAVAKAQAKAAETQAKIDFLDETGSEEFCEKEFKVYQALKVIEEGSGSRIDKARAIARLVD